MTISDNPAQKWFINESILASLTGCFKPVIKQFFETQRSFINQAQTTPTDWGPGHNRAEPASSTPVRWPLPIAQAYSRTRIDQNERMQPAPATTAVMNSGIALAESVCPQRSPHAMAPAARHSILTEIQRVRWSSFLWLFALPDSALDLLPILTCLTLLTLPVSRYWVCSLALQMLIAMRLL
jgi:hypothetical protein